MILCGQSLEPQLEVEWRKGTAAGFAVDTQDFGIERTNWATAR